MKKLLCLVGLGVVSACNSAMAAIDPNSMTPPVDVGEYITLAITNLGSVVAVAVGGYFAFFIVRKALRWAKRIG